MLQQINLYQPIFREERKLFSANAIGVALGIMTAGLLSISLFSWWRIASLDHLLVAVQAQEAEKQVLVARTNSIIDQGETADGLDLRLKSMALELERRQRALRYLRGDDAAKSRPNGARGGFAERLAALARQQLDGLWLTGVTFTADSGDLALTGGATSAELVPIYLERLANEPALAGTKLQSIEIRRPAKPVRGDIEFAVSSATAAGGPP